jgi:hypothetical protein
MPEFEFVKSVSLAAPVGFTGSGLHTNEALSGLFAVEHSSAGPSG